MSGTILDIFALKRFLTPFRFPSARPWFKKGSPSASSIWCVRRFNLYADLLALIGHRDPTLGTEPPHLYAASCRWVKKGNRAVLEAWSNALAIGQALPTLPLWLSADLVVPLDLESSYEQACSDLWIG